MMILMQRTNHADAGLEAAHQHNALRGLRTQGSRYADGGPRKGRRQTIAEQAYAARPTLIATTMASVSSRATATRVVMV